MSPPTPPAPPPSSTPQPLVTLPAMPQPAMPQPALNDARPVLMMLNAGAIVVAALYFGQELLVPLALAAMLAFVLAPASAALAATVPATQGCRADRRACSPSRLIGGVGAGGGAPRSGCSRTTWQPIESTVAQKVARSHDGRRDHGRTDHQRHPAAVRFQRQPRLQLRRHPGHRSLHRACARPRKFAPTAARPAGHCLRGAGVHHLHPARQRGSCGTGWCA